MMKHEDAKLLLKLFLSPFMLFKEGERTAINKDKTQVRNNMFNINFLTFDTFAGGVQKSFAPKKLFYVEH